MKSREIIDYAGWQTGATVKSYEWKSQPTRGPFTGKPIRAIAVKDEFGRFWGGIRFGAGATEKARAGFWSKPFESRNAAIDEARHSAREALSAEAEMYSEKMLPNAQPGKEIVRVTMDDGWSVAIDALVRITPAENGVMAMPDGRGKEEQTMGDTPANDNSDIKKIVWNGPSVETDEGRTIHGVAGQTHEGGYRAGFATVYMEGGPNGRSAEIGTTYSGRGEGFSEKNHAIFASRKEVQNQQSYDRAEPESQKAVSDPRSRLERIWNKISTPRKARVKRSNRDWPSR